MLLLSHISHPSFPEVLKDHSPACSSGALTIHTCITHP